MKRKVVRRTQPPDLITADAVREWVALLQSKTLETARGSEGALSASFLRLLLQSGEMLLRTDFLTDYNRQLGLHPQLANGLQPTADMGGDLITKWNVDEILLPAHGTFATFAVPLFALGGRSETRRGPRTTLTLRSRLDWAALAWHSQYLLMCTRCHTPQGPRSLLATPRAKAPSIGQQIEKILGPSRTIPVPRPRGLPKQPGIFVQDEVWGHMTPNIGPGDFGRRRPKPMDMSLAGLLDAVTGISGYLPALPQPLQQERLDGHVDRLLPVATVLKQLRCVRCGRLDTIRYLPRIMMPIDLDLSPEAHSERARRRTTHLHRARLFQTKHPALSGVLWIPPTYDAGELLETSKGLFHLLDRLGANPLDDRARYWPVCIWVHEATKRANGTHWRSLLPRFRENCRPPIEWSAIGPLLENLPSRLPGTGKKPGAVKRALATLDLLLTVEYRAAREVLRSDYETHALLDARKYFAGK